MVPILTVEQMRKLDEFVINRDDSGRCLMAHAGKALARELERFERIAIVCGPGNNGGDGYAAAYALQNAYLSHPQQIDIFYTKTPKSEESIFFYENLDSPTIRLFDFTDAGPVACGRLSTRAGLGARDQTTAPAPPASGHSKPFCHSELSWHSEQSEESPFSGYDVVVDCLLGTGFQGVPRGTIRDAIDAINSSSTFVISMDINSGVNGDTGDGEIGVKSDLTLTIGYPKTGMLKPAFKNWAREVHSANIGYELTPQNLAPFAPGEVKFMDEAALGIVLL